MEMTPAAYDIGDEPEVVGPETKAGFECSRSWFQDKVGEYYKDNWGKLSTSQKLFMLFEKAVKIWVIISLYVASAEANEKIRQVSANYQSLTNQLDVTTQQAQTARAAALNATSELAELQADYSNLIAQLNVADAKVTNASNAANIALSQMNLTNAAADEANANAQAATDAAYSALSQMNLTNAAADKASVNALAATYAANNATDKLSALQGDYTDLVSQLAVANEKVANASRASEALFDTAQGSIGSLRSSFQLEVNGFQTPLAAVFPCRCAYSGTDYDTSVIIAGLGNPDGNLTLVTNGDCVRRFNTNMATSTGCQNLFPGYTPEIFVSCDFTQVYVQKCAGAGDPDVLQRSSSGQWGGDCQSSPETKPIQPCVRVNHVFVAAMYIQIISDLSQCV